MRHELFKAYTYIRPRFRGFNQGNGMLNQISGAARLNRVFLASLVASGAFTFMSAGQAQEAPGAGPKPLVTAPSIRSSVLDQAPAGAPQALPGAAVLGQGVGAAPAAGAPATPDVSLDATADSVPWVLETSQHPWPLRYQAPASLPRLYLSLPSEQEARIMLPGRSADEADRTRGVVEKFVTNSIGTAAQDRARQLEAVYEWVTRSSTQQRSLSADPWQAYQFSKEALQQILTYRKSLEKQSDIGLESMVADVVLAVAKVTPLMSVMPSYELQMAWYNVLKQLKEGVSLYNEQVVAADAKLVQTVDQYIAGNPPVPRPEGRKPEPNVGGLAVSAEIASPSLAGPADLRTPAQPAPQAADKSASSEGGWVATAVGLGLIAAIAGLFMKLRRKVKGNKAAEPPQA